MTSLSTSKPITAKPTSADNAGPLGLSVTTWVQIGIILALFAAVFYPNLTRLWLKTAPMIGSPNWSHSVAVPIIGLYYLFMRREDLLVAPVKPLLGLDFTKSRFIGGGVVIALGLVGWLLGPVLLGDMQVGLFNVGNIAETAGLGLAGFGVLVLMLDWGLASLIGGLVLSALAIWRIQNDYIWDIAMILALFGVVLTLTGWAVTKYCLFPIAFLICAIPWPPIVYSQIATPLQFLAANAAVVVLNLTGVAAVVEGTVINIPMDNGQIEPLNVAEACAGMRSLMTFITVGAAVGFLSDRPLWQKWIITLSAIPIAIFCNMLRVSGMGVLYHYVSRDYATGFAHSFVGLVLLVPAFFMILGVAWLTDRLIIEEADDEESPDEPAQTTKPATA
ncbi:MAG: exosortase/archaeosortase family protein [Planctomycetota bacterium]